MKSLGSRLWGLCLRISLPNLLFSGDLCHAVFLQLWWCFVLNAAVCVLTDLNCPSPQTLRVPLSLKYACPSESTWKLAVASLLKVLSIGLPVARQHASSGKFDSMWPELASTLEDFLFTKRSAH